MPTNITEVDEFTTNVAVPENADDIDADASGAFRGGRQALANRTKYLKGRIDVSGVTRIASVTDAAALKALEDITTGALCIISLADADAFGLYQFKEEAAIGTDIEGWVYAADDEVGNWYAINGNLMALGGAGSDQPRLDAATIRAPYTPPGVPTTTQNTTSYGITTGSVGTLFGPTLALSLVAGDVVMLDGAVLYDLGTGTGYGLVRLTVAGVAVPGSDRYWHSDGGTYQSLCPGGLYTAGATGSVDLQLLYVSDAAGGVASLKNPQLRALIIRPLPAMALEATLTASASGWTASLALLEGAAVVEASGSTVAVALDALRVAALRQVAEEAAAQSVTLSPEGLANAEATVRGACSLALYRQQTTAPVLRVTDPYGLDVSTFPGLDPAFKLITGQRVIAEAVARRWVTPRGSLAYDPDYGEDVRGYLHARIDGPRLRALEASLTAQALADERVSGAVVQLAVTGSGPAVSLRASASLDSSAGPFRLVLTVSQLALDLEVLRA